MRENDELISLEHNRVQSAIQKEVAAFYVYFYDCISN